ncbi:YfgM family protein [Stutzerimonas tarimensis]|uniref:Ancillary SecYEG translocon subunit n=1 Tax=Stutzerimonas tarimensis TaxID=1507735 RepID=A0ABV7T7V4_9GAMM
MASGSDDEQLAQIKDWWQRNGMPLLVGAVLALVLVFGWQGWQRHQANQAQSGSVLYQELLTRVLDDGQPNTAEIVRLGNRLKDDHGRSHYAQYGRLLLAKVAVDEGRLEDAASELRAVVDAPADDTLEELSRQRLALVLAAQGQAEQGLALIDGEAAEFFRASREEIRGDLLLQLGQEERARAAYVKAMESQAPDAAVGALQMKVDDLAREEA